MMRVIILIATVLLLSARCAWCETRVAILADDATQAVSDLLTAQLL